MSYKIKKIIYALCLTLGSSNFAYSTSPKDQEIVPVVILGSGVGAMTSAIYLARAGIHPILIEGSSPGGAIMQSLHVENWPGELNISGLDLSQKIRLQAEANGTTFRSEEVIAVDFSKKPFTIQTRDIYNNEQTHTLLAESCIIALGTTPNYLEVPGETTYWSKGVYTCAVCDGTLYKDKIVAVVGSGDTSIIDVDYLSNIAKEVHLIIRGSSVKALEKEKATRVLAKKNVFVKYNTRIVEILGDESQISHLSLQDSNQKESSKIAVDALFLAIGSKPNSDLFKNQLDMSSSGYILTKDDLQTSQSAVFAIGDITDPIYKQAISAAGDGAKAAIQVQKMISQNHSSTSNSLKKAIAVQEEVPSKPIEISSVEQFKQELLNTSTPVLVDFYAPWCGPCRNFAPIFEALAGTYKGKIKLLKVNISDLQKLSETFRISTIPSVILFSKEGDIIEKKIGTRDINELIKNLDKY